MSKVGEVVVVDAWVHANEQYAGRQRAALRVSRETRKRCIHPSMTPSQHERTPKKKNKSALLLFMIDKSTTDSRRS